VENLKSDMNEVKRYLEKSMERTEMEVILDLKREVNDLRKLIEVKMEATHSTPKKIDYDNMGWKRTVQQSPMTSLGKDWKGDVGTHSTNWCWKKRMKWKVKDDELLIEWKKEYAQRHMMK